MGEINMNYSEYTANSMVQSGKINSYKNHIIKNIEIIGQRKLAIISDSGDYELLMKAFDQLKKKNVHVPETAFKVCLKETEANPEEDIRFFDELKGKGSTFYALILKPYTATEIQIAAMDGIVGSSQEIAEALKTDCGYTDRDLCQMNDPEGSGLSGSMGAKKASGAVSAEAKKSLSMANGTAAQLSGYRGKMNNYRCFIIGNNSAKLNELNVILNERTITCNDICEFFTKTPLRPTYYLLTSASAYLGNGKYIEGLESFVNGNITVFEDKFKKKPTYLSHLSNGLIDGLPTFQSVLSSWDTARAMPMYEMLQLAMYMGFKEIFIYGFDGLFELEYTHGVGRKPADGAAAGFPENVRDILSHVKTYADNNGITIYNMCDTAGLDMFRKQRFEDIDFTASSIFSKI